MDERLVLDRLQADAVLEALEPECAMERRARRRGEESGADLFRRLATGQGFAQFQWHPQKLAGRVQTVIMRPDLTIEVWELNGARSRRREDLETTAALSPVRDRLEALAREWGLREEELPEVVLSSGPRERLSGLATRR